jgi:hypothetical protein
LKQPQYNAFFVSGMLAVALVFGFIGCDNGTTGATEDTTGPVLSLQAVAEYTGTADGATVTVVFTSNEAGSYYVQTLDSANAAPDAVTLAGSGLTGTITAGVTATVSITDLAKGSPYKAHVTVKDAAGNYSAVWSSSSSFTVKNCWFSISPICMLMGHIANNSRQQ